MKRSKKIMAGIMSVTMALSCTTALAKWEFSGYDTTDSAILSGQFGKIYYEVDENGIPTNNEKIDGYANRVEWVHDYFEKDFPHAGINRLYLDGVKTSVIQDSGTVADWPTEFRPEAWEVKYPYNVYERLWSKVDNKSWSPNFAYPGRGIANADVYKYLGKQAEVTSEFKPFGFGRYRIIDKSVIESSAYYPGKELALRRWFGAKDIHGNYIIDVQDLYTRLGMTADAFPFEGDTILGAPMTDLADGTETSSLSGLNGNRKHVCDDAQIAARITTYRSEFLTGPDYKTGGKRTVDSVTYYDELTDVTSPAYDPSASLDWFNAGILAKSDMPTSIDWSKPVYEKDYPYYNYQYMIVNGVVLDGSWVAPNVWLPRVFRYTGGQASPKVEWKYSFAEAAYPHAIYCEKFLDGNPTGVLGFFDEKAGGYGIVLYGENQGELDYKLKSVYGVQDYDADDISFKGYYAWVPVTEETAIAIKKATDAAVKN